MPDKIAENIINYRKQIGIFKDKEELLKLYAINSEMFEKLEEYIIISQLNDTLEIDDTKSAVKENSQAKEDILIEINSADKIELQKIKGIGPAFANWIVEYRDKIGGFYDKEQLLEVYKIDREKLKAISPYFLIDKSQVIKLSINTADVEKLKTHPYINYNQARAIVAYRDQHGDFQAVNEIVKIYLFTQDDVDRLLPYLDIN